MYRIPEIKILLTDEKTNVKNAILRKLQIPEEELLEYEITKSSIDARNKNNIFFVYAVDVKIKNHKKISSALKKQYIVPAPLRDYSYVQIGSKKLSSPPVIIGMGPAGLFAGLILSQMGYSPVILERGKKVEDRMKDVQAFWKSGGLNTESNVQFGEGGAGTFSDGKLTTQIKDTVRCRKVLKELILAGAPQEIIHKSKPHIGTDILCKVAANMRNRILELGGTIFFESKATDFIIKDGKIKGVQINNSDVVEAEIVLLAVGHSARDTFQVLMDKGLKMTQKPFAIGVRIEHPQEMINQAQYGSFYNHPQLGAADYKLAYHSPGGRSAYTFCMCPGGLVVAASSEENMVVTNGMSYYARDNQNANSALLVGVGPDDFGSSHPLAGMFFQRIWEKKAFEAGGKNYFAPAQLVKDFLADKPSIQIESVKPTYMPGIHLTNLNSCLPDYVIDTMKESITALNLRLKGFSLRDAVLTGVETRSSSPVWLERDADYESNIKGIYPIGEGAGYAGGIVSAAVDGIRSAEEIAKTFAL